jgi:hypothetical protein
MCVRSPKALSINILGKPELLMDSRPWLGDSWLEMEQYNNYSLADHP